MNKIKLSEWAKLNNVCYRTAWNYYKQGQFEGKSEICKGKIYIFSDLVTEKPQKLSEKDILLDILNSINKIHCYLERK